VKGAHEESHGATLFIPSDILAVKSCHEWKKKEEETEEGEEQEKKGGGQIGLDIPSVRSFAATAATAAPAAAQVFSPSLEAREAGSRTPPPLPPILSFAGDRERRKNSFPTAISFPSSLSFWTGDCVCV
jgi:hypothetical protein